MPGFTAQAVRIEHETDPRDAIMEQVKGLYEQLIIGGADVLIAIYKRIGRTKGGIYLSDRTSDEDDFQGNSGLVLKLGPHAYKSERTERWFVDNDGNPRPPVPGDWVLFDVKIGLPFKLGKKTCRLIDDQRVMSILPWPDIVQ
jgi:hypothetical protein